MPATVPATRPTPRPGFYGHSRPKVPNIWADLNAFQHHRNTQASIAAEALVAELIKLAPDWRDHELEDELCARVGMRLAEWAGSPPSDHVGPDMFAEAIITAAATAVHEALKEVSAKPDGWQPAWRVLNVMASTVPYALSVDAAEAIESLRDVDGGRVLPTTPDGPSVAGEVLWTRDAYGSRFGVIAAFSTPGESDRWYLWDIDACAFKPCTVHSAYYPTPEQALAAWQAGVGEPAAAHAAFTPVDAPGLLMELLPSEEGFLRPGGENTDQLAEYHRSMRLAEAASKAVRSLSDPEKKVDLDATTAVTQFAAWLQEHRAGQPQPAELDELITELADSWQISSPAELYPTCSPHRVAMTIPHLRDYYLDDFAAQIIALLPDWVRWLTSRNGTPAELAERCLPYALGEPRADILADDGRPNYLARVVE